MGFVIYNKGVNNDKNNESPDNVRYFQVMNKMNDQPMKVKNLQKDFQISQDSPYYKGQVQKKDYAFFDKNIINYDFLKMKIDNEIKKSHDQYDFAKETEYSKIYNDFSKSQTKFKLQKSEIRQQVETRENLKIFGENLDKPFAVSNPSDKLNHKLVIQIDEHKELINKKDLLISFNDSNYKNNSRPMSAYQKFNAKTQIQTATIHKQSDAQKNQQIIKHSFVNDSLSFENIQVVDVDPQTKDEQEFEQIIQDLTQKNSSQKIAGFIKQNRCQSAQHKPVSKNIKVFDENIQKISDNYIQLSNINSIQKFTNFQLKSSYNNSRPCSSCRASPANQFMQSQEIKQQNSRPSTAVQQKTFNLSRPQNSIQQTPKYYNYSRPSTAQTKYIHKQQNEKENKYDEISENKLKQMKLSDVVKNHNNHQKLKCEQDNHNSQLLEQVYIQKNQKTINSFNNQRIIDSIISDLQRQNGIMKKLYTKKN